MPPPVGAGMKQVCLCKMSVNKNAPRWSIPGRHSDKEPQANAPGPGAYAYTRPDMDKYCRSPKYGFGSATRSCSDLKGMPGPGAYDPFDPKAISKKFGFGKETRIGMRGAAGPGPGAYETRGGMEGLKMSMGSRFPQGKRPSSPGPGAYNPSLAAAREAQPRFGFGNASRADLGRAQSPGPGTYNPNFNHSAPKYSIRPRSAPAQRPDTAQGGIMYTQFCWGC